jgi:hypothetical protein
MENKYFILVYLVLIINSLYAQVGLDTNDPKTTFHIIGSAADAAAADGILLPALSIIQLESKMGAATYGADQDGAIVYINDVSAGSTIPETSGITKKGIYYYDSTADRWFTVGESKLWSTTGNAGTDETTDFIGTTDAQALNFRVDNQRVGRLSTSSGTYFGYEAGLNDFGGNRNVFIGWRAGKDKSSPPNTATHNTAIGYLSFSSGGSGGHNTALGSATLLNNTGEYNTAVGSGAMTTNGSGNNNTAIGGLALFGNVGNGNVAIGYNAGSSESGSNKLYIENSDADSDNALIYGEFDNDILRTNGTFQIGNPASSGYGFPSIDGSADQVLQTDGSGNVNWVDASGLASDRWSLTGNAINPAVHFLGTTNDESLHFKINNLDAGKIGKFSDGSVFLGQNSGENDDESGNANTGIGRFALQNVTTGFENAAFGVSALRNNTSFRNTGLGSFSLFENIDGQQNSAVGNRALSDNVSGDNNVAFGAVAGRFVEGTNNTFLGSESGTINTNTTRSLSGSVFVGYQAGRNETNDDRLYIENSDANNNNALIYGEFDNDILRTNGTFQIGNPSGTGFAFPTSDGTANQILQTDGSGNLGWTDSSSFGKWQDNGNYLSPLDGPNEKVNIGGSISTSANLNILNSNGNALFIETNQTSAATGISNEITTTSTTGSTTAISNILDTASNSTAMSNFFVNSTSAGRVGVYNSFTSDNTTSDSGVSNLFDGDKGANAEGFSNTFRHNTSSTTTTVGLNNLFQIVEGTGNLVGTRHNFVSGMTNTGSKTGTRIDIDPSLSGTHYGIYSNVTNGSGYAGYFLGRISIGTTTSNNYILPSSRGTDEQVLQTDDSGNVSWVDASELSSDRWSLFGNAGTDETTNFIGTTDNQALIFKVNNAKSGRIGSVGDNSVFLGYRAGESDDLSDNGNTFIGSNSGRENTSGQLNSTLGISALMNNTTGLKNIAIGSISLFNNLSGNYNIALGSSALASNTSGSNNIAIGDESASGNQTGDFNITVGYQALNNNLSGTDNVAIGNEAGLYDQDSSQNTFIGNQAGRYNGTSFLNRIGNVFLGYQAGYFETGSNKLYIENSNASANTALIYGEFDNNILRTNASFQVSNSSNNEFLGQIFDELGDGRMYLYSNNTPQIDLNARGTVVFNERGLNRDFRIEGDSNENLFFVDAFTDVVRFGSDTGNLDDNNQNQGLTTLEYVADFDLGSAGTTIGIGTAEKIVDGGGFITIIDADFIPYTDDDRTLGNSVFRWEAMWSVNGTIQTSDYTLKKNIKPLKYGLQELMQIETITYNWKQPENSSKKIGFSAQNLLNILPEVVVKEESVVIDEETNAKAMRPVKNLGVYYSDIIPVVVKAIQEQQDIIKSQKEDIAQLKAIVKQQQNQIDALINKIEK